MIVIKKIIKTFRDAMYHQTPIKYIFARFLVKTGLCEFLKINRDGYKLHFFRTNVSVSMWLLGRDYYRDEENLIKKLLKPGDSFVDVGANIGHLSIVGKRQVADGRVIAIEAHPQTALYAKENFRLNRIDVEMLNFAVGDKPGVMIFTNLFADDCNSIAQGEENGNPVTVKTLDELLIELKEIRLLKIDVEGYELMVFQGATDVLKRVQFVYFELWDKLTVKYKYSPRDIIQLLEGLKFKIYHVNNLLEYELINPNESFSKLENLLAISDTIFNEGQSL